MSKIETLEEALQKCRSAEQKAIVNLFPVFERDFIILYHTFKGTNLNFEVQDSVGGTADVQIEDNLISISEHSSCPDYDIRIKEKKGRIQITIGYTYGIATGQETFFGVRRRELLEFLALCGAKYDTNKTRIDKCLSQMASLPNACLKYLKNFEQGKSNAQELVDKIKGTSSTFVESLNLIRYYQESPDSFQSIFKMLNPEERKRVLERIIASKSGPREVNRWLSDNYPELVKEAGMDYILKMEERE